MMPLSVGSTSAGDNSSLRQKLVLVCFSYQNDFSVLTTSLESLKRCCTDIDFDYLLVADRKAPFTRGQVAVLEERVGRAIEQRTTPFFHGHRGVRVFLNELSIFRALAGSLPPTAWITKVDSDVLFLGPEYLEFLRADREHDYVFQDVRTTLPAHLQRWPSYSQGGCYSFRAGLFRDACPSSAAWPFLRAFWEFLGARRFAWYFSLGEDFLVYYYLSPHSRAALSTSFFVPCPFRQEPVSLQSPRFPSLMHFERCSHEMKKYYAELVSCTALAGNEGEWQGRLHSGGA